MTNVILHIPHSSIWVPEDIRRSILLSDDQLEHELLRLTDRYTDELFHVNDPSVSRIVYPVSRLVVDPERFLDDVDEPMSKKGMGVIYTRTTNGTTLRKPPGEEERIRLLSTYYRKHHDQFNDLIEKALTRFAYCLIIDCHSFPAKPLPFDDDQDIKRPDICIGTDDYHTPEWLKQEVIKLFTAKGFFVKLNCPFSGSFVPTAYYQKDKKVSSIMIELNRSLYMDELTGEKLNEFIKFLKVLSGILISLLRYFDSHH